MIRCRSDVYIRVVDMAEYSSAQLAYLRKLAHSLKPLVQVGKLGVTGDLVGAVLRALDAHELIKVKFNEHQDDRTDLSTLLAEETGATLVTVIGNTAILYRPHPERERRTIILPAANH